MPTLNDLQSPQRLTRSAKNAPAAGHTYVLRHWFRADDEDHGPMMHRVVIVRSPTPLAPDQLMNRVRHMVPDPASLELIECDENATIVLDTWERYIEHESPLEARDPIAYGGWWSFATVAAIPE